MAICVRSPHSAMNTPMKDLPRTAHLPIMLESAAALADDGSACDGQGSLEASMSMHSSTPFSSDSSTSLPRVAGATICWLSLAS
eukprot:CAMPEP_0175194928 /NCGR_PEP_ID=MMETSP0093-20121207/6741_1 /TAXON_ID=311494 /ORGANISM="Alexandrium monilatum, Strain CCMP3105" /LENGTH=83 /DNA_ID=CAMNT_0016487859 /DNA_START=14 /DNA_END=262 /DNA_ORIENTATION=-